MTHASLPLLLPPLRPGLLGGLAGLALIAASAQTASAQTPPADLPPLGSTPPPVKTPAAPPAPTTPPPPAGLGQPIVPPVTRPLPAGSPAWSSGDVPPGYARPGYPSYPNYYGQTYIPALSDPYALPPLPPRRRYDSGLFVGGVFAVSGGMAVALLGAYLVSSAIGRIDIYCDSPSIPCAHKTDDPRLVGGAVTMTLGALVGAAGIPMWFLGSRWVVIPKGEKDEKAASTPEIRLGAGSASATFRF